MLKLFRLDINGIAFDLIKRIMRALNVLPKPVGLANIADIGVGN